MTPRIGSTIGAALELRGWKHQDLSDALAKRGVTMSANSITKVRRGIRTARWDEVQAISEALNVPLSWLSEGPDWMGGSDVASSQTGPSRKRADTGGNNTSKRATVAQAA